jgi:hypothetical protein
VSLPPPATPSAPTPWGSNDADLAAKYTPYVLWISLPHYRVAVEALGRAPWDVRAQPRGVRRRVRPAFPPLTSLEMHAHVVFAIGVSGRNPEYWERTLLAFQCYLHWITDFAELEEHGRLMRSETVDFAAVTAGADAVRFVESGREVPAPPGWGQGATP